MSQARLTVVFTKGHKIDMTVRGLLAKVGLLDAWVLGLEHDNNLRVIQVFARQVDAERARLAMKAAGLVTEETICSVEAKQVLLMIAEALAW